LRGEEPVRLAGGWFVLREEYCWLVVGGWFVLREKYCWLVADKPSEQAGRCYFSRRESIGVGTGRLLESYFPNFFFLKMVLGDKYTFSWSCSNS
jgi:hypothetical protein